MRDARAQAFVAEMMVDLCATAAARRAGYSPTTAARMACELMADPEVQAQLNRAFAERQQRVIGDADFVLRRLMEHAGADMADIYSESGELLPMREWPLIWRQGLVVGVEHATIPGTEVRITKVRLADRTKLLELLGKHVKVNAFEERHQHQHEAGSTLAGLLKQLAVGGGAAVALPVSSRPSDDEAAG